MVTEREKLWDLCCANGKCSRHKRVLKDEMAIVRDEKAYEVVAGELVKRMCKSCGGQLMRVLTPLNTTAKGGCDGRTSHVEDGRYRKEIGFCENTGEPAVARVVDGRTNEPVVTVLSRGAIGRAIAHAVASESDKSALN